MASFMNITRNDSFSVLDQPVVLLAEDGTTAFSIPLPFIDASLQYAFSSAINYGSQIGACLMMLVVLLVMTPQSRFARTPTRIAIASLALNAVRMVLLSLYFTSSWWELYTYFTLDTTYVRQRDYNISVVATVMSIPVTMLIEMALFVQAWSMIRLWSAAAKWTVTALSLALVLGTVAVDAASAVAQSHYIVWGTSWNYALNMHKAQLVLITTTISWFTCLFCIRLVTHMVKNRSLLPSVRGLGAMDVLVMTNGILMLVPAFFAGLQWAQFANFEAGSLTQTSVIVVLPLGSLVAQRLADPAAFSGPSANSRSSQGAAPGASSSSRKPFLASWNSSASSSRAQNSSPATSPVTSSPPRLREKVDDPYEAELARIDDEDLERGHGIVRSVDIEVQRS